MSAVSAANRVTEEQARSSLKRKKEEGLKRYAERLSDRKKFQDAIMGGEVAGAPASEKKMSDVIRLNVGGTRFETTRATLTRIPDSFFGRMFDPSQSIEARKQEDGSYFIDRDPKVFACVLDQLRSAHDIERYRFPRQLITEERFIEELEFYGLATPPAPEDACDDASWDTEDERHDMQKRLYLEPLVKQMCSRVARAIAVGVKTSHRYKALFGALVNARAPSSNGEMSMHVVKGDLAVDDVDPSTGSASHIDAAEFLAKLKVDAAGTAIAADKLARVRKAMKVEFCCNNVSIAAVESWTKKKKKHTVVSIEGFNDDAFRQVDDNTTYIAKLTFNWSYSDPVGEKTAKKARLASKKQREEERLAAKKKAKAEARAASKEGESS